MSNKAHFFDIDTLVKLDSKAWIVDKKNPNNPLLKISKSDLHLIESGIYKNHNNKIEFNGKTFWIPTELYNKIKIKAKVNKTDLANLAISLQEFYNKQVIDELDLTFNLDTLITLKNTQPDIYIVCSRQTKDSYQTIVEKLKEKLYEEGLKVKAFYYIYESFYDIDNDEVRFKKIKLILQHLIGYKTSGNSFTGDEITRYQQIYFYDDQLDTLELSNQVNPLLNFLYSKTRKGLRDVIKENVVEFEPFVIFNKINDNQFNRLETKKINLELSRFIQSFESYSLFDKYKKL